MRRTITAAVLSLLVLAGGAAMSGAAGASTTAAAPAVVRCQAIAGHTLYPLPDRNCTPGITWSRVTQADIGSTICRSGWTATIRPPERYTERLKVLGIAQYGYGDRRLGDFEEDHLIPLELGGSPTAPRNLWPEYDAGHIPNKKDAVENALRRAVCAGRVGLAAAQRAIAVNWTTAERKLGL